MQNRNRQHNEIGYLMLNGPDDAKSQIKEFFICLIANY